MFAEQGNRVRIPDTEGISFLRLQPMNHRVQRGWQNSESSCISKVLFSMREIPACGENRSLEGLSWLREKAEAMRLCKGEKPLRMDRSVRRPTNPETKNWQHSDSFLSAYLSIPLRSQRRGAFASSRRRQTQTRQDTKAMVRTIIVFLIHKILFILTGRCQQVTPPTGAKGSIDTREGSK